MAQETLIEALRKVTSGPAIFLYLLFNPMKTSKEIAKAIKIDESVVRKALYDMAEMGLLERRKIFTGIGRRPYIYSIRLPLPKVEE